MPPLKKPAAERKEERKKNSWVDTPKEKKKEHPPKGKGKSIMKTVPSKDDGRLCSAQHYPFHYCSSSSTHIAKKYVLIVCRCGEDDHE
ncbi:hypothetical protein QL285_019801 [Trifolium repens]|nr:hypothetical protein QL285_019801 [Trifolium repens]